MDGVLQVQHQLGTTTYVGTNIKKLLQLKSRRNDIMATFVSEGKSASIVAPRNLSKGDFVFLGCLFGVATEWALQGQQVAILLSGIFEIDKDEAEDWCAGNMLYWDPETSKVTSGKSNRAFVAVALSSKGTKALVRIFGLALHDSDVQHFLPTSFE